MDFPSCIFLARSEMNMFYSYVINSYPPKTISTEANYICMRNKRPFSTFFSIHLIFPENLCRCIVYACEKKKKTKEFSFIPYTIIACGGMSLTDLYLEAVKMTYSVTL